MAQRLGIFSIYDAEGILDKAVLKTAQDLRTCLHYMVVVINGTLQETYQKQLAQIADEVVVRPNLGFDAGAYKEILFHRLTKEQLQRYDQFVLCNDTFYGPFIPFQEIFSEMEQRDCDFWALSYSDGQLIDFLHSYFLCFYAAPFFKVVYPYMQRYVHTGGTTLNAVYSFFEEAMFQRLCENGYRFSSYALANNLILYRCNNIFLRQYHLPVVKKKFFSPQYFVQENVLDALHYINDVYPEHLPDILTSIRRKFQLVISQEEISATPPLTPIPFFRENGMIATRDSLRKFLANHHRCYIYGAGQWGQILYAVFVEPTGKMQGFICSDKAHVPPEGQILGVPAYPLCDIQPDDSTGIIVALGAKNTQEVKPLLSRFKNLFFLY